MKLKKYISRYCRFSRYFSQSTIDANHFKVIEFRRLRTDEPYDEKFEEWSRIYEYPLVLDCVSKYVGRDDISVHNTSWGFEGVHILFKNLMEARFKQVVNTDINASAEPNTAVLDITVAPPEEYVEKFDVVLNVSTVEEVDADHLAIVENLLTQVRPGGYLMITFDIPGMQLSKIEKTFNARIERYDNELNGINSVVPNKKYATLGCGLLVVQKRA